MIREIKSALNRLFRTDINYNFEWLKAEKERIESEKDNEIRALHARIDSIVGQGTSNQEVLDARVDADGQIYSTLKSRLDAQYIYAWDTSKNCRVRIYVKDGALTTQRKINNVWTDY